MKKFMVAGLVAASALFVGCGGNACEDAADRMVEKYEECGIDTTTDGDGDTDGEEAECTEEMGTAAEKMADCIEKASCDSIKDNTWFSKC